MKATITRRGFMKSVPLGVAASGAVAEAAESRDQAIRRLEDQARSVLQGRPYSLSIQKVQTNGNRTEIFVWGARPGVRTFVYRFTIRYDVRRRRMELVLPPTRVQ